MILDNRWYKDSREIFEKLTEETDRSILVSTATECGGKTSGRIYRKE